MNAAAGRDGGAPGVGRRDLHEGADVKGQRGERLEVDAVEGEGEA